MIEAEWWEFDSAAEMAQQAAGDIGFVIESAVEAHGGARIALPSGPVLDLIGGPLIKSHGDWTKVTVIPTDDRLLASGDPLSGAGRLRAAFGPAGATVIPLADEAVLNDYREAGRRADEALAQLDWPLDFVCLHVTDEGHTASILPGPDFDRALTGPRGRRAIGLHPDPAIAGERMDRVTLTADALASARTVMIVARGDAERAALERAIDEGPLSSRSIGRVLALLEADVDIFWSAD